MESVKQLVLPALSSQGCLQKPRGQCSLGGDQQEGGAGEHSTGVQWSCAKKWCM